MTTPWTKRIYVICLTIIIGVCVLAGAPIEIISMLIGAMLTLVNPKE